MPLTLQPRVFSSSVGLVTFALTGLCATLVSLFPGAANTVYGYVMHLEMSGAVQPPSWGMLGYGVIGVSLVIAGAAWLVATLYNASLQRGVVS